MKNIPIVSIVGRPNVGKSSLFNRILRRKIAVVDDRPGVTRDRNYMNTAWNGVQFRIVDTGGIIPTSKDNIPIEINKQVDVAIDESVAIVFLVEANVGPTDFDQLIAQRLRKRASDKIILVANKAETITAQRDAVSHYTLGCGDISTVSAIHGKGIGDLLDEIVRIIKIQAPKRAKKVVNDIDLSIAVIGRPNAGKSSFVNKLLGDERMIVDNIPGTTRDAIDSIVIYDSKKIRLIDTAGLRKKSQVNDDVEYYSNLRALNSIKKADVCILLVDTDRKLGEQDLKILTRINTIKRGAILCWNKWDIIEKSDKTFDHLVKATKAQYMELQYTPMISISALTGMRVNRAIDVALAVKERMVKWLPPATLKEAFFGWIREHPHPFVSNKEVRFLGVKQQRSDHPRFIFFCNNPTYVVPAYRRYLINKFQSTFDFSGCPVIFEFKNVGKRKRGTFETNKINSDINKE